MFASDDAATAEKVADLDTNDYHLNRYLKIRDKSVLLSGDNGEFEKNGAEGLAFKSSDELDDLVSVSVDDAVIDEANYTKASGSTIITLKPEYLDTLSVGEHTLTITSNTGAVTANFTIAAKAAADAEDDTPAQPGGETPTKPGDNNPAQPGKHNPAPAPADQSVPQTGDGSNMILWATLMFAAGIWIVAVTVLDRKKKEKYSR